MRDLTEDEILQAIRAANLGGNAVRLTYDSGPYEVTRPTPIAEALARAVVRKFCEVNGLPAGVPVGWKLVPIEATSEMGRAGEQYAEATHNRPKGAWWWRRLCEAMIAAAPHGVTPSFNYQSKEN